MGKMKISYNILVGKPEGKRPLGGKPRRRREDNIRKYFRKIRWESLGWMHLAQDRDKWRLLVEALMKFRVQ
jgi:hypothetical protein